MSTLGLLSDAFLGIRRKVAFWRKRKFLESFSQVIQWLLHTFQIKLGKFQLSKINLESSNFPNQIWNSKFKLESWNFPNLIWKVGCCYCLKHGIVFRWGVWLYVLVMRLGGVLRPPVDLTPFFEFKFRLKPCQKTQVSEGTTLPPLEFIMVAVLIVESTLQLSEFIVIAVLIVESSLQPLEFIMIVVLVVFTASWGVIMVMIMIMVMVTACGVITFSPSP